ncbi:MAG TPA: oligosaccharide flippase family protein [Novosphingobium sp.]|nr:oligosaccharide flippase family protein [Novosphingobium sp.]
MTVPSPPENPPGTAASSGLLRKLAEQSSFSGNVAANYAGRVWEAAMSVAFVPLYIHHLGSEAYGIIGILAVIQSFMLVLDFGMTPTLTREAARYQAGEHDAVHLKDLIRSVEWVIAVVAVLIIGGLALAAPTIAQRWVRADALSATTIAHALTIGGALIALRFVESVFRGTLYGLQRQLLCNVIAAVFATLRGVGAIVVIAWLDGGLGGFFLWQVLISLCIVIALRSGVALALPQTSRSGHFSREALASIGRFALGMVAISVLSLAATQADKIVLSRLISLKTFGYYVFAANVALLLELVAAPIMTALYPRVVEFVARRDETGLDDFFHHWAQVITVLTAPAATWLFYFAPAIILAWSGNPVLAANSGTLLAIIAIGTFLHGQCVLPYYFQLATGWTSLSIWTNAVALAIMVPSLLLFVPRYGANAGVWTWVAVASVYFFGALNVMFGRMLPGARWRFYLIDTGLPSAVAFGTMGLLARTGLIEPSQPWWLRAALLGVALLVTLAVTAGVVFVSRSRLRARGLEA